MKFLLLLIVATYALGMVGIVTQIIIPAYAGRPYFPMFRRRGLEKESQLAEVMQERDLNWSGKLVTAANQMLEREKQ